MANAVCRAIRLLYLMALLEDRPYRVTELAERCGVTRQCIYRDLLALAGEPIRFPLVVEGGKWRKFKRSDLE